MEKFSLPSASSHQLKEKRGDNDIADSLTWIECQKVKEIEKDMTKCSIKTTNEGEFNKSNKFKSILLSTELGSEIATLGSHSHFPSLLCSQQQPTLSISLPYRVAHCQKELGRYLIAAKDLQKGEIILQEYPITSGPERDSPLICPKCYEEPHESYTCDKCHWPLCGPTCPGINPHHMECSLISEHYNNNNYKLQFNNKSRDFWKLLSDNLMIIRCLSLKYFDPSKWARLMMSETNYELWSRSPLYDRAKVTIDILQEIGIVDQDHFTMQEMLTVQAVLDINAYEIRMPYTNIQASYAEASLAEHNCVPNMHKTISSKTLLLTLRASVDIPKGSNLSTSYCDILWPTVQRQQYLQWSKFFICKCKRCTDPTELNSLLSALICPLCSNETPILPNLTKTDNGLEGGGERLSEDFNFDYNCSLCSTSFPVSQVLRTAEEQLEELDKDQTIEKTTEYQKWMARWTTFPAKDFGHSQSTNNTNWMRTSLPDDTTKKDMDIEKKPSSTPNVHQVEKISPQSTQEHEKLLSLSTSSSSPQLLLHSHHSLVLDACHTLFLLLSTDEFTTDEELEYKIQLGIHLIESTKYILTGISKFRGTILSEIGVTKMTILMRRLNQTNNFDETITQLTQDSIDTLKSSLEMLKYEPLDQPEGILAQTCTQQLTQLTSFLETLSPSTRPQPFNPPSAPKPSDLTFLLP